MKNTSVGNADATKNFVAHECSIFPVETRAIVDTTPPAAIMQTDVYDSNPFPCRRGRVLLIGDAAHPVVHHFGQGACLAVEDAVRLCRCLVAAREASAVRGKGAGAATTGTKSAGSATPSSLNGAVVANALERFDTWSYWFRTWALVFISRWCGETYMDNHWSTNAVLRFCFLFPFRLLFTTTMRVLLFWCHRDLRSFAETQLSRPKPRASSGSPPETR